MTGDYINTCYYTLYATPQVAEHGMDSGRKSGYYAAILSGKERLWSSECKYSEVLCKLTVSVMHVGIFTCLLQ